MNMALSICHSAWVKGDHTNFEIYPFFGVEATELYPDVKYTTVDEYLNMILRIPTTMDEYLDKFL